MTTLAKMKRTLEAKMKAVYGHRIDELGSKLAAYQETNATLTARLAEAELLWMTAIECEGTDWANDMKLLAAEAAKGVE